MPLYIKGTDVPLIGTLERLEGTAYAVGLQDDGSITFTGLTSIDDESAETAIDPDGNVVWIGQDGECFYGVRVEDRRADGSVVQFIPLEANDKVEDIADDLKDLIRRVQQFDGLSPDVNRFLVMALGSL